MVGGLQSNKINEAISLFTCIHSVDRHKILEGINKNITEDSSLKEVFIQVNISNEASKGGIEVSEVDDFLGGAKKYGNINILGLMTMPPPNEEPSVYFALLNIYFDYPNFDKYFFIYINRVRNMIRIFLYNIFNSNFF